MAETSESGSNWGYLKKQIYLSTATVVIGQKGLIWQQTFSESHSSNHFRQDDSPGRIS